MLLSKTSEYGIRAMLHLAGVGGDVYLPVKRISKDLDISFHFLTKIFQQLTRAELVDSYRGPNGGVRLRCEVRSIAVKDILVALEGDDLFTKCVLGLPECGEGHPCPLHEHWARSRMQIETMFGGKSLIDLGAELRSGGFRLRATGEWTEPTK